jgi:hypothetical protein
LKDGKEDTAVCWHTSFFAISFGLILTKASSGNAEKALKAWSAKIFLSAKNKIRGLRLPSRFKFQRV